MTRVLNSSGSITQEILMGKIKTDELEERVGSAGITVNSTVKIDTIAEKTSGSGVTIDGL